MDFPPDLPHLLQYKTGNVIRITMPRRAVEFVGGSGATNAMQVCPTIPLGATGWRVKDGEPWKPLAELPKEWLPFLMRRRGTAHDPRPRNLMQEYENEQTLLHAGAQGTAGG